MRLSMNDTPPLRQAARPPNIADAMRNVRTKRQLADLFRYLNLRPTRRLGQNFLADHNLLAYMVRAAEVGSRDLVLDIGTGTGLLTAHLAAAAAQVLTIETDRRLYAIASRYLEDKPNVEMLLGDALASKHALSPLLLEAIRRHLESGTCAAFRVVSNLPYSTASLIVPNLLESRLPFTTMVVTVQKEVAERMAASPGGAEYGALSVLVQAQARVRILRLVPPDVFWPRPKVESALLRVEPDPRRREPLRDYPSFAALVRAAFGHRRKTLLNSLVASHGVGERPAIEAALAACGIAPNDRAEHLSLPQYVALANALARDEDAPPAAPEP
jgi:16S rRNA (adenine1518-N6/adenine1519-N6)-dimethyltransferase